MAVRCAFPARLLKHTGARWKRAGKPALLPQIARALLFLGFHLLQRRGLDHNRWARLAAEYRGRCFGRRLGGTIRIVGNHHQTAFLQRLIEIDRNRRNR